LGLICCDSPSGGHSKIQTFQRSNAMMTTTIHSSSRYDWRSIQEQHVYLTKIVPMMTYKVAYLLASQWVAIIGGPLSMFSLNNKPFNTRASVCIFFPGELRYEGLSILEWLELGASWHTGTMSMRIQIVSTWRSVCLGNRELNIRIN
jgi:hypothetical protein